MALHNFIFFFQIHFQSGSANKLRFIYCLIVCAPQSGLTSLHNHDGHMFNHFLLCPRETNEERAPDEVEEIALGSKISPPPSPAWVCALPVSSPEINWLLISSPQSPVCLLTAGRRGLICVVQPQPLAKRCLDSPHPPLPPPPSPVPSNPCASISVRRGQMKRTVWLHSRPH